jgi:hypothetical protein
VWLPILPMNIDMESDSCLSLPNGGNEPEPGSWNNGTGEGAGAGAGEGVNGAAWALNTLLLPPPS